MSRIERESSGVTQNTAATPMPTLEKLGAAQLLATVLSSLEIVSYTVSPKC